ncbi:MAG: hypothetical protein ACD_79C00466G0003 [uncultured bacterium]|nr:MAG: hypothetical protein ACD_79C00466G0003 [uncultured bacterium]
MSGMNKFIKQAKKMQEKMDSLQKELSESLIEVETSGGAIAITISGDEILQTIKIDPAIVDKNDVEGLEDLVLTAVNQALKEAKKFSEEKTKEITGNIQLPGGLSF